MGGTYNLYCCSASGKVLLAHAGDAFIASYLEQPLPYLTENTFTDLQMLLRELENIRNNGYAIDDEEGSCGPLCIAAPIISGNGNVPKAVGCSFTTLTHSKETVLEVCGQDVIRTAKGISTCCGMWYDICKATWFVVFCHIM